MLKKKMESSSLENKGKGKMLEVDDSNEGVYKLLAKMIDYLKKRVLIYGDCSSSSNREQLYNNGNLEWEIKKFYKIFKDASDQNIESLDYFGSQSVDEMRKPKPTDEIITLSPQENEFLMKIRELWSSNK